MAGSLAHKSQEPRVSIEEYWAIEKDSEIKHEWIDGQIYPLSEIKNMAGATTQHNRIMMTVGRLLGNQLFRKSCEPFGSDQRIKVPSTGMRAYPDIQVVCPPFEYDDELPDTITNPKVIIEILSPSTQHKDRTKKWFNYQQLESLTDYLMISQEERLIEHYVRHEGGGWHYNMVENDGEIVLASIDCKLNLDDVYERVE